MCLCVLKGGSGAFAISSAVLYSNGSQNMVPGPASPGNVLEMQILGLRPAQPNSKLRML